MLAFMKNLIGVKMDKAASAGIEALVRWDPKSASVAELRTMEQHLDELGREVALSRQGFDREQSEAEAIQTLSQQRMAAAELLQRQIDGESDPARRTALEKSLETLVSMLEQMAPEFEREKSEAADAKEYLTMLEQTYAEAGGKLKTARSELERAQRDMARAAQQREQARLLRPTRPEQDDPNIAAAMATAAGKPPAPQSLSERLAALKGH
jgi:chromosome segregation ATPase